MTASLPFDDSDWDIPEHTAALYGERCHPHALVIPVINEGERIRGQLERIRAANLPVDVIIADGGSTDGSLAEDFVRAAGVRALLIKTGPGKLSAQLRMAYAWCLREGYAGIVTMDGNGKDGVEAVAAMVAKLEEGCDYVQGSRYLPGGVAENTPLERTIANRLIHAPLLSLAGRHVFLDTTNGFRAYSRRYLLHPDVQPFRTVFDVYSLLFYLTVRAGQLGLKVAQVPVARRYPQTGKVPTKIGGLGSKLALLGETVHAATGGYTPERAGRACPRLIWPLLVALAVLLPLFLTAWIAPAFSPDSWALYELSRTVFGDFYRFTHFRSYASAAHYSASFPPLTPVLMALVDSVMGTGPRTGLVLAFAAFTGFALVSEEIGRRVTGAAWIGLGVALVLLLGPGMVAEEMAAARKIPLQLLLFSLMLWLLLAGRAISFARAALIGLIAGLAVLNRADALLLPMLAALLTGWLTRRPDRALIALATSLLVLAPWMAWSWMTFGSIFATDNSGTAFSLDPKAFVTDWWPEARPRAWGDPAVWAMRILGNALGLARTALSLVATPMMLAFALAPGLVFGLQWLGSRRPGSCTPVSLGQPLRTLIAFTGLTALLLAPQVLTGYAEYRYFTALIWAAFLALLCAAVIRGGTPAQRATFGALAGAVLILAGLASTLAGAAQAAMAGQLSAPHHARFAADPAVTTLARCLASEPDARVLVLGDDSLAARAGALGGIATMMEPRNMADGRLDKAGIAAFTQVWQVDYVLIARPERQTWARANFALERVEGCAAPLWRLAR